MIFAYSIFVRMWKLWFGLRADRRLGKSEFQCMCKDEANGGIAKLSKTVEKRQRRLASELFKEKIQLCRWTNSEK